MRTKFILDIDGVILDLYGHVASTTDYVKERLSHKGDVDDGTIDYHDPIFNYYAFKAIEKYNKTFKSCNGKPNPNDYPAILNDFKEFYEKISEEPEEYEICAMVTARRPSELKILRNMDIYGTIFRMCPIFFTSGDSKVDTVQKIANSGYPGDQFVFVDDSPNNVMQMKVITTFEQFESYLMIGNHLSESYTGVMKYKTIHSLLELL